MTDVKPPGWMVWGPDFGSPRYVHGSYESAVGEARRLATVNPGHRFFVMEPGGFAYLPKPEAAFTRLADDEVAEPLVPRRSRDELTDDIPF